MRIVHAVCGLVLGGLFVAGPAHAEDSAKQFLAKIDGQNRDEAQLFRIALAAYGTGISWANLEVERRGGKPLYCQPDNLALTEDQKVDMVRRHIEKFPDEADYPAGMVLLFTFQNTFPCGSQKEQANRSDMQP